ncbi:retrovirus-related pol polyprotein from transposon TNT 1-94 [Tanacetum coccineum]
MQNGRVVVQNVHGRQNTVQGNNARGIVAAGNGGLSTELPKRPQNSDYFKEKMLLMQAQENRVDLDEEQLLFLAVDQCDVFDSDVDEASTAQTIFMTNLSSADLVYDGAEFDKTCKKKITPTGLTEGERGFEQTKTCYLTEVIPFFKTIKDHFEGIQKALINEIKEMKEVFDQMEAEVDQHAVDKKCDEIERKNLLTENENLIVECLSKDVFYTATIQKDDHDEMIKYFSKLEVEHLNLQLKYQHLKERFGNKKSVTSSDAPAFESVFIIGNLKEQLQGRGNTIRELKEKILRLQKKHSEADPILDFKALDSQNKYLNAKVNPLQDLNEHFRVENEKVKQLYKELYDSIKLMRAKTIEKTTSLLTEIETLKAQIKGKMKCVTMPDPVKAKVLAPDMYAIDVGPILYSSNTLDELHCCSYFEGKDFNKRNRKIATAPLNRKKRVTFMEPGVKDATADSGSKPRSNTKKDRTLPAKSDMKKVEAHSRNNKSSVKQKNRVDSSISFKRTIINLNSTSVYKTCNKCLMSFNHDKCVVKSLKFVKKPSWQPTGRKFTLGEQRPLTMITEFKVMPAKQPESVSTSKIVITERLSNTSHKPLTRTPTEIGDSTYQTLHIRLFSNAGRTDHPLVFGLRFGNDHFGAIMGYRDYVIGDSVISMSKASKNKSWLWRRRLNHLNFGTINDLARKDLVRGLPRLKFKKDHLCSACQLGKNQKYSHKPKSENTTLKVLNTLHMDLCGPMRVQTINGKKYILVIVDDYSRFTWVKFLRSKDETPKFVIKFLKQIQVGLNKTVRYIRTDNGT